MVSNHPFIRMTAEVPDDSEPRESKRVKFYWIAVTVLGSVIIITVGTLSGIALHHHLKAPTLKDYDTEIIYRGLHIPEHARVDYINEVTYVNNTRNGEVLATNNVYDFKKRMMVIKDIANRKCYIDTLDRTFGVDEVFLAKKKRTEPTPSKVVVTSVNLVEEKVIRKFAGNFISDHCYNISTHWIIDVLGSDGIVPSLRPDCSNTTGDDLCFTKENITAILPSHINTILVLG